MTNSCCAPNCWEGYKPKKKKHNENSEGTETSKVSTKKFTLFSFPKHDTEPEKRAQWIARITLKKTGILLPVQRFTFVNVIFIHIIFHKKNATLIHKRLTPDAIPSLWPDTPSYLSKTSYDRQTTLGSSESRQEKVQNIRKRINRNVLKTIHSEH